MHKNLSNKCSPKIPTPKRMCGVSWVSNFPFKYLFKYFRISYSSIFKIIKEDGLVSIKF